MQRGTGQRAAYHRVTVCILALPARFVAHRL